jgi:iron complex outermembrane receptor protein
MRIPLAVVSVLLSTGVAWAQQPPPTLPPVVVEGARVTPDRTRTPEEAREEIERVPGGVDLIPQRRIEESRAANLKDALDFTPGVLIRPRFGSDESQLSIRGSGLRNNFHLRGVSVLIDGFPYGNADGFSDFESLELLVAKRIEVYKGGNALRLGGYTLGGAINIVTKTGLDASPIELRNEAGSYGYLKNYLASGFARDPFDVYVGLSHTELNGYRDYAEQTRRRAYGTFGWTLGGGRSLRLDLTYVNSQENLPGSLTRDEFARDPRRADPTNVATRAARDYDYTRGALTFRTPVGENQTLEWATQLNYQDMDHPLSFAIIDNVTYSGSTELRWILAAPLFGLGNRLTAGLQYFGTRQADVNFATVLGERGAKTKDQTNLSHLVALYAEEQLDVAKPLALVAGARGQYAVREVRDRFFRDAAGDRDANDSDAVDFLSLSPKVGFVWRLGGGAQVYGNASHSYEPPLMLELTAPGQLQGNLGQLAAQKAWQFELGTRGGWAKRVTWDLSVYDIELWDEIQNVNVRPFPGAGFTIPRFRNIDRSRHTGLEAMADVVLVRDIARAAGLGTAGDSLSMRGAYTFSRFVFVDDVNFGNNDLPGAPRHALRGELRWEHPSGLSIVPNVEIVPTSYFVDSANTNTAPGYALYHLRLGYDVKRWKLSAFLEARNLADKAYVSSVVVDSATGRYFEPGDGRALYGGVQWNW